MKSNIIEITNLKKSYDKKEIIKGITFAIKRGEICGLVGNNGEGKTTIIRTILGLMKADSGEIKWNMTKNVIGYMPQVCKFIDSKSVEQTLKFFCDLKDYSIDNPLKMCERFHLDRKKKVKMPIINLIHDLIEGKKDKEEMLKFLIQK